MRLPNGTGSITKMSGNRRRPWRVRVTVGWELDEQTEKAKQISKTIGYYATKKEATLALAEFNANPYDLLHKDITFKQAYESWTPAHFKKYTVAAATLSSAYKHCEPIKDMRMQDIRKKHLQDIMDTLANASVSAQAQLKTVFKKTFKYCLENDIITKDYSQFVTISQTPIKQDIKNKFFTKEEIKKVLDNKDYIVQYPIGKKSYADLKLVDSVIVLLYTGMRISELLNIKTADVNIEQRIINVHGTKTDAAERIVPIHKEIASYIKNRVVQGYEYLFSNNNGKPFAPGAYRKYFFEPFMEHIGAEHTPHATRHTFVSIMDSCGITSSSVVLKRIVGHANQTVTEHYTHKDIEDLINAIDKFIIEM